MYTSTHTHTHAHTHINRPIANKSGTSFIQITGTTHNTDETMMKALEASNNATKSINLNQELSHHAGISLIEPQM